VLRVARRGAMLAAAGGAAAATWLALDRIGVDSILATLVRSQPVPVLAALALMCLSMVFRAIAWRAILAAALPAARPRFRDAFQGTTIGVLMSATLPARLGELSRALIVARRLGRPREHLPVVLGTMVSQTLINVFALVLMGSVMFATVGLFQGRQQALLWYAVAPVVAMMAVLVAPVLLRSGLPSRSARLGGLLAQVRGALARVRHGLIVFRRPRLGSVATSAQLTAWVIQWLSCFMLLVALHLEHQAGLGAAAAVLFAVNVSAVLPLTPSNLGVFQAATVAVLTGAYGVDAAQALGYGIILQAVEIATAVIMGAPALVTEGLSWREVRLRALHTSPVSLAPPRRGAQTAEFEA
jgi:phosphatidylinositol alpha-mannosyltransferase